MPTGISPLRQLVDPPGGGYLQRGQALGHLSDGEDCLLARRAEDGVAVDRLGNELLERRSSELREVRRTCLGHERRRDRLCLRDRLRRQRELGVEPVAGVTEDVDRLRDELLQRSGVPGRLIDQRADPSLELSLEGALVRLAEGLAERAKRPCQVRRRPCPERRAGSGRT